MAATGGSSTAAAGRPAFWDYVVHSGLPLGGEFQLRLPNWSSQAAVADRDRAKHSTCLGWRRDAVRHQFLALGVDPDQAWKLASEGGRKLKIGAGNCMPLAPRTGESMRRYDELWKESLIPKSRKSGNFSSSVQVQDDGRLFWRV